MELITKREYARLRAKGWHANAAMHTARVAADWEALDGIVCDYYGSEDQGETVRLRIVADECCSMDDLKGDTYNRAVNPDIPESRMAREESAFEERVERDGVCGVIGEYFDGTDWQHADSCWGFVGEDWKDSGYDSDIMQSTIDQYREFGKTTDGKLAALCDAILKAADSDVEDFDSQWLLSAATEHGLTIRSAE